jgi:hypothetical protein
MMGGAIAVGGWLVVVDARQLALAAERILFPTCRKSSKLR